MPRRTVLTERQREAIFALPRDVAMTTFLGHPTMVTIDCRIPFSRGGDPELRTDNSNLAAVCLACHWQKGFMTEEEYLFSLKAEAPC